MQEGEVVCGVRRCGGRRRHRIDDRRMGIRRESADDLHTRFDPGVGRIDDAEHGFAARDQRQRRAHASAIANWLGRSQAPNFSSAALAYLPTGTD